MNLQQLIEKLKTYPPKDHARFYCDQNKSYYYFIYTKRSDTLTLYIVSDMRGWMHISYSEMIDHLENLTSRYETFIIEEKSLKRTKFEIQ